jgi:Spy/CpxP family protein refolding chaperone
MIFSGAALAQQTPQTSQNNNATAPARQRDPQMRRMMRHGRMRQGMAGLRQLNLSDQQRQQMRSIAQAQGQSTQTQRQELRQLMQKRRTGTLTPQDETRAKELRQQLMQSREGVHTQMLTVLTPEQKTQLDQMIKIRRENRGNRRPGKQRII